MTKNVATLILTAIVLVVGVGGALGALALDSQDMALSILGFAGGALSGTAVAPRVTEALSKKKEDPE